MTKDRETLKGALEALLFITDRPLGLKELGELLEPGKEDLKDLIEELRREYEPRKGVQILEVAEGFQMGTRPGFGDSIRKLYQDRTTFRLSTAALETLAIVAYRQPLTRAEIEEVRGVEVIAALETLLEKRLIRVVGRKETIGRPLLYGTTMEFLRQFGLASLEALPPLDEFAAAAAEEGSAVRGEEGRSPAPSAEQAESPAAETTEAPPETEEQAASSDVTEESQDPEEGTGGLAQDVEEGEREVSEVPESEIEAEAASSDAEPASRAPEAGEAGDVIDAGEGDVSQSAESETEDSAPPPAEKAES